MRGDFLTSGAYTLAHHSPPRLRNFLHAFALHFGAAGVALAVDADEVEVVELGKLVSDSSIRRQQFAVGAIDHVELAHWGRQQPGDGSRFASGHLAIEPTVPGALSFSTEISHTHVQF